jgi:hypothetical protein
MTLSARRRSTLCVAADMRDGAHHQRSRANLLVEDGLLVSAVLGPDTKLHGRV